MVKLMFIPNFGLRKSNNKRYIPQSDFDFLKGLVGNNVKVKILALTSPIDTPLSDTCIESIENVDEAFSDILWDNRNSVVKLFSYAKALVASLQAINNHDGLIYIYFPGHLPILGALVCQVLGKKYALYVRGEWKEDGFKGWLARNIFAKAEFIFTTGVSFKSIIALENIRVDLVYPMLSFNVSDAQRVHSRAVQNHDFSNGLFVGKLGELKGALDVIRAVKLSKDKGFYLSVTFAGGGSEKDILLFQALAESEGVSDRVKYIGHVSDADALMGCFRDADFFVYPSFYPEGFPRVIYEAMLFGVPIVCTVLRGMENFMVHRENCMEVPSQSPEAIATALCELASDKELRKNIGTAAHKKAISYLSSIKPKGHAAQLLEKLRKI